MRIARQKWEANIGGFASFERSVLMAVLADESAVTAEMPVGTGFLLWLK
jgi:hypothetical protein